MGWDAFGLPAEQYAVKTTLLKLKKNIAVFKKQIQALGFSYDWDREINTTDPDYYKWTQWIFLKIFEKGLAYQEEAPVNWCPEFKAILSHEEVADVVSAGCTPVFTSSTVRADTLFGATYCVLPPDTTSLISNPNFWANSQSL